MDMKIPSCECCDTCQIASCGSPTDYIQNDDGQDRSIGLWLMEVRNQTGRETGFRVTDRADCDGCEGVGLSSCCLVHLDSRSIPVHLAEVSWI